jgi:hypothetical protein
MKRIGRIGAKPLEDLADRAALFVCELSKPTDYALTLSPEGFLALERSNEAAEEDVIGHYDPNQYRVPRWIGLGKQIREDLQHEVNARLATTYRT